MVVPGNRAKEPWNETYLKVLLLHIDKVKFVQSFLMPSYKTTNDMPTFTGAIQFGLAFVFAAFLYGTFVVLTNNNFDGRTKGTVMVYVLFFFPVVIAPLIIGYILLKFKQITNGRFAALMEMANVKPPKRDHSKAYGYTFYKTTFQEIVYVYCGVVFPLSAVLSGDPNVSFNMTVLVFLFMDPVTNVISMVWNSTAISDCEVIIAGAMPGQIVFAEGESNAIAVNLDALATLEWKDTSVREELEKAAANNKGYGFSVFDTSSGYHMTISSAGPKKNDEKGTSVTRAVMMQCRGDLKAMLEENVTDVFLDAVA